MDTIFAYFIEELDVILKAPVIFSIVMICLWGMAFLVCRGFLANRIKGLKERIEFNEAIIENFKSKTATNSPSEAGEKIIEFETVLTSLGAALRLKQIEILKRELSAVKGTVGIGSDIVAHEAFGLVAQITHLFKTSGWKVVPCTFTDDDSPTGM